MSSPSSPDAAARAPHSLAIHLDLVGGIAGDMFVAAMIDALPDLAAPVSVELAAIQPHGASIPAFAEGTSGGLRVRRFGLASPDPRSGPAHEHADRADASHGTPYPALRARIEKAPLSPATRTHALALLLLLGEAEGRVHGIPLEQVHFHELADWDSLLDMVAAGCIAARLQGASWTASALPVGGGMVRAAHGLLPVPTPATAALLTGYPWRDDGIPGERVTPTGAAILRHLVDRESCGGPREAGRLAAAGYGAGTRELPGMPNVLRVLVFERNFAADVERIAVLEFDVDDMTGEEIALAADRLRTIEGVTDVSLGTRQGKKGRPVTEFRVLARLPAVDAVTRCCFRETSTLGLRVREEQRRVVARSDVATTVGDAGVRVKLAERPGGVRTAKAAHDDAATLEGLHVRRDIRARAERQALDGGDE